MDAKILLKKVDTMKLPALPTFADVVDQMLFKFKDSNDVRLLIQKISPNNYRFGTKKIFAKVNNGILLVRVGGGFMDIDNFYKTYGAQEL
jgi:hypothetical protein